jgi:pimeloyl-ACP methyl ester carboxylesterase
MNTTKPSIVFCDGIWADGSSFSKVIPPLQAEGYEVIAAQYGLDTPEGDVATVKRTLGRVSSPAILVGHSYGGSVVTAAGTDDRVAGLVYITALAPDADETSQSQQEKFPVTDVFKYVELAEGRLWTCSRNWNDSWRSGWVQASTLSTAATSRCCPIQASSSTLSVPPQRPFKDHPPELDGRRGCASIKTRLDEHHFIGKRASPANAGAAPQQVSPKASERARATLITAA